jgi:hypothetical protein
MTGPAPHGTAPQYAQAQQDEWSRYVAIVPLDYYGTRAYNVGDPVPLSAVVTDGDPTGELGAPWVRRDWVTERSDEQVVTSQTAPPPGQPTIDPASVAAPQGAAAAPPPDSSDDGSSITSSEG